MSTAYLVRYKTYWSISFVSDCTCCVVIRQQKRLLLKAYCDFLSAITSGLPRLGRKDSCPRLAPPSARRFPANGLLVAAGPQHTLQVRASRYYTTCTGKKSQRCVAGFTSGSHRQGSKQLRLLVDCQMLCRCRLLEMHRSWKAHIWIAQMLTSIPTPFPYMSNCWQGDDSSRLVLETRSWHLSYRPKAPPVCQNKMF
jgi:hypothetical protein